MPKRKRAVFACLTLCLMVCAGFGHEKLAVKAGRIIPVGSAEIEKGVILIEKGRITAVGRDIQIPYDFWVMDEPDSVAFPGMVEGFTTRGLDRENESLPVMPFLDVYDAIDPSTVYFEDALRDGVTTLFISQGSDTVIGGLARVVKPIGMTVDEMTVKPEAGIILAFSPKRGYDRMIQMATFRETFRELEDYLEKLAERKYEEKLKAEDKKIDVGPEEARKRGRALIKDEDLDFKHLNLVRLKRGDLLPILYCAEPVDVMHGIQTAKEQGFLNNAVFVLENPCYRAVDLLKESGRPVILYPRMTYRKIDPLTGDEEEIFIPGVYHEAGIAFAVRTHHRSDFGLRYLWYQAAALVRNGIPRAAALEAITRTPARIVGLGERVGSIAPGMDGNILLLTGDPLEAETWVDKVIIEGKIVYERAKDYRLKELLTGQEIQPEEAKNNEGSDSQNEE